MLPGVERDEVESWRGGDTLNLAPGAPYRLPYLSPFQHTNYRRFVLTLFRLLIHTALSISLLFYARIMFFTYLRLVVLPYLTITGILNKSSI